MRVKDSTDRVLFSIIAVMGVVLVVMVGAFCVEIYDELTEPKSGTITGKSHRPAHTSTSCHGKPVHCTTTHHPECWEVRYRASNGDRGDACVPERDYDTYTIGSWYPHA